MGTNSEPSSVVLHNFKTLSVLHKVLHNPEPSSVLHNSEPSSVVLHNSEPLVLHQVNSEPLSHLHRSEPLSHLHRSEPLSVLHNAAPLSVLHNAEPLLVPHDFQEDRISKLPDDILVDILSKIKFKEAGQTSVLSHRWLNLWRYVPHIHLVSTEDPRIRQYKQRNQENRVFVNRVNRVVYLHKSSSLCEFRIVHELDKSFQDEIDKWLEYALGMGVQRLELNLSVHGTLGYRVEDSYNFPNQLFHQITKFGDQLATKIGFSCLKELCFSCVNISGEAIECLLLKCPLLEDLRVIGSGLLVNVVVSGPSLRLKHLEISYCTFAASITISNTNIVFLKVFVNNRISLSLNNLPMLTEVWYKCDIPEKRIVSSQLACFLSQLTVLTLEVFDPKSIMKLHKFSVLQKLRRLMLVAYFCEYKSLIGLTSLIESCPHLVEFAVMLIPVGKKSCEVQETATKQSLKGLKVFEFYGYYGDYEYEDELIMFILENAVALEKIVIDPRTHDNYHGREIVDDERSKESRKHAVEKFKNLVPKQVELVIL